MKAKGGTELQLAELKKREGTSGFEEKRNR